MSVPLIIFTVLSAVLLLLFMVLKLKINAFVSLIIIAMYVGVLTGMPLNDILKSIQNGMGNTLGFVAVVVGLGAIFGQILESSGGAEVLAHHLIRKFGKEKASWAMTLTGFIIAIPVFFDVGFIILVPIVYALSKDAKKSLLYYAIPLLAGLAVTHSFIPPTPGPVAVAEIIDVSLGWVILFGFLIGLPTAIIAGPVFGKYINTKVIIKFRKELYSHIETKENSNLKKVPAFRMVVILIGIPLFLIVAGTLTDLFIQHGNIHESLFTEILLFAGHPFAALTISTLLAIYFLGIRTGKSRQEILDLSTRALGPAGIIILITGAGGVLKQILIDSGMGDIMAHSIAASSLSPILLAWLIAAIVRITQGSATVSMITAAGIVAPVLNAMGVSDIQKALIVLAIASGATMLSHVNDSGFWLVGKYLGLNEKQTLQTWTVMESIIALCGLFFCLLTSLFFN